MGGSREGSFAAGAAPVFSRGSHHNTRPPMTSSPSRPHSQAPGRAGPWRTFRRNLAGRVLRADGLQLPAQAQFVTIAELALDAPLPFHFPGQGRVGGKVALERRALGRRQGIVEVSFYFFLLIHVVAASRFGVLNNLIRERREEERGTVYDVRALRPYFRTNRTFVQ